MYVPADELKQILETKRLSIVKASKLLGCHRDTIQKWFRNNKVPAEVMTKVRQLDLRVLDFNREFMYPMTMMGCSYEEFCERTGTPMQTLQQWKAQKVIPKWVACLIQHHRNELDLNQKLQEAQAKIDKLTRDE